MTRRSAVAGQVSDLTLVVALVGLAGGLLLLTDGQGVLQWLLAIPFLLVVPGYAFVCALLPGLPGRETDLATDDAGSATGWPVRLALALTSSVIVVGVVGAVLAATVGLTRTNAVLLIAAVTVVLSLVAGVRRNLLASRRQVDGRRAQREGAPGFLGDTTLQTVAMALALIALVSAVGLAATGPSQSAQYSEFYALSETGDGNLTATELPASIAAGESQPLYFGVENHEERTMSYDVVGLSQRVGPNGSVTDEERIDRFNIQVEHGERAIVERTPALSATGEARRLQFLLYKDGVPQDPGTENADLSVHVWANVTDGSGT